MIVLVQAHCTQPLTTQVLYQPAASLNPYTIVPGTLVLEGNGGTYGTSTFGTFLSLAFRLPLPGGPIQVCLALIAC